jgi:hypothetical protein
MVEDLTRELFNTRRLLTAIPLDSIAKIKELKIYLRGLFE